MIIGKGAGVILISKDGSVLLQHRDRRNKWNKDSWSEFGGQIEKGEMPEEAAKRELKEELGIKIEKLKFFKKYSINRADGAIYMQFVFIAPINQSVQILKKQQKEGDDLAFFTAEEIEDLKTASYTKKILKDYFHL